MDGNGVTMEAADVNQHVYDYLDFFLARDKKPNFAAMISGNWGIGKTFLIRRYLDAKCASDQKRYLYVSLYGLASVSEIEEAVIEELFPIMGNKKVQFTGKLAIAALKTFKIELPNVGCTDLFDRFGNMIIVFDDLERCKLEPAITLGFINRYVEHDTCSVIVLANEGEINRNFDDYTRVKEKVVGKTLAILPSFGEALSAFINQLKVPDLCSFLYAQKSNLEAIYQASGTHNLRTLFQVLLDYERVWGVVDPAFRSNTEAMAALLKLIAALSFELKSGAIKSDDLIDRHVNWLIAYMKDQAEENLTSWQKACRRYPTVDLQGQLLSDDVLLAILTRGEVKSKDINACLALSSFFVDEAEPAWRTLWHSFYRSDEALNTAYAVFEQEFLDGAFTDPGVVLHAFGLKLMLADMGLGAKNRAAAAKLCIDYIDRLETAGALEPLQPHAFPMSDTGYSGLGFIQSDSEDFIKLRNALRERQNKVYNDRLPLLADEVLREMETNPDLFWRRINHNSLGDQLYADVPIFASYDPETFVDRLQALNPSHQNSVVSAIASRYDHDALNRKLIDEKPWIQSVCQCLMDRANKASPFARNRIHVHVKEILAPKIGLKF